MGRIVQKRTLKTRARLIASAQQLIADAGYNALRIEDVVKLSGVAKGTFFAHFKDKDTLMDLLIGEAIDEALTQMEALPAVRSVGDLVDALIPTVAVMTRERYVFDVVLRLSGALAVEEVGPIANTFTRLFGILVEMTAEGPFRKDVPPALLAEGIQAFCTNAMALHFCALHGGDDIRTRLVRYLNAWLTP